MPDEKSLFQLHRAGTLFLLDKPARYRDVGMELARHSDGKIVYRAPPPRQVKKLMKQFFRELTTLWTKGDALDVAAYAAWRLGWIHPFLDGNGRTARLFAYACLCVRLGGALPDTYTLVDQISSDQDRWVRLLLAANRSFERGALNLRPLKRYLDELLLKQIRSAE